MSEMHIDEKAQLMEHILGYPKVAALVDTDGPIARHIGEAIVAYTQKEPTEGSTCADTCRPDYEKMNAELMKELDYWKSEHRSLREENIRLEAILRTVESWTGKNFLG